MQKSTNKKILKLLNKNIIFNHNKVKLTKYVKIIVMCDSIYFHNYKGKQTLSYKPLKKFGDKLLYHLSMLSFPLSRDVIPLRRNEI